MSQPRYGLLLDIDGPISNPDAKQIIEPTIIDSLLTLMEQGNAVVFNTGRADAFVRERVFGPMLSAGPTRVDRLHAICEKGAVWLSVNDDHRIVEELDKDIAVPSDIWDAVETLVNERFLATMFFDQDERTMVSVERNLTTSHDEYMQAQPKFTSAVLDLLVSMGYGVKLHDRLLPNPAGEVTYRIDPSIISCDIESVLTGKDLGAARAYQLLEQTASLPQQWRTVGDSDGDYAMAQWLQERSHAVKHLDVRGAEKASLQSDFEVLRPRKTLFDDAGAAYLRWLIHSNGDEADFDITAIA